MTRRKNLGLYTNEKNPLDIASNNDLVYSREPSHPSKRSALSGNATSEGNITINEDTWETIVLPVAQYLVRNPGGNYPDPDYYDLFDWIRINIYGGQEYGKGILAKVDAEIEKELGPWT